VTKTLTLTNMALAPVVVDGNQETTPTSGLSWSIFTAGIELTGTARYDGSTWSITCVGIPVVEWLLVAE
jgi:hypothetical protein